FTQSSEAITGMELEEMSDDELRERVKIVDILRECLLNIS
ncbi:unnamed protein product, partial [marine sediment metagenome]